MRYAAILAFALTVMAPPVCAQPSEIFEAADVRPSGPDSVFQSTLTSSQFIARRHTLAMLIESSYPEMPSWRMSGGPAWMTTDMWDFVAKLPSGAPRDQESLYRATEQMLRTFLATEFKLKTHFVKKDYPVYNLVVAKGGLKLKPSETTERGARPLPGGIEFHHETLEEFASFLFCPNCYRQAADRPVFDKTGLTGYYDITLHWAPAGTQTDASELGPSIFTALEEQLGLKLQPQKAPADFLVIDQAERPTPN